MSEDIFKVKVMQLKVSLPVIKVFARRMNSENRNLFSDLKKCFNDTPAVDPVVGEYYIAKASPDQYERCYSKAIDNDKATATLSFLDCGFEATLPFRNLRVLSNPNLRKLKSIGKEFILAHVIVTGGFGYMDKLKTLHNSIVGSVLEMSVLDRSSFGAFVDFDLNGVSVVKDIVPNDIDLRSILAIVPIQTQTQMLEAKQRESDDDSIMNFKLPTLTLSPKSQRQGHREILGPGKTYKVRISAYDDGPYSFYVQLTSCDKEYQEFQTDLQKLKNTLCQHFTVPSVGTKCILNTDNTLFRVKILSSEDDDHVLQFLESGDKVTLTDQHKLFAMPASLPQIPPFAKRLKIDKFEPNAVPQLTREEVKFFFQHLTNQKRLKITIVSVDDGIPTCKLFSNDEIVNDVDLIEELKKWIPHEVNYPPQKPLRESEYNVSIIHCTSPKDFNVVITGTSQYTQFEIVFQKLQFYDAPRLRALAKDDACIVKTERQTFRGRILELTTPEICKVQAVDLGFIDDFQQSEIRIITKEFAKLPPMAIPCCLRGFENKQISKEVANKFINIMHSSPECHMKILEKGDKLLVELTDLKGGNVDTNLGNISVNSDWTQNASSRSEHFLKLRETHTLNQSGVLSYTFTSEASDLPSPPSLSPSVHNSTGIEDNDSNGIWSDSSLQSVRKHPKVSPPKVVTYPKSMIAASSKSSSGCSSESGDFSLVAREPARITAVVSTQDFTIQSPKMLNEYEAHQRKIQLAVQTLVPLTSFEAGTYCLAFRPDCFSWYRCSVFKSSVDPFRVDVKCFDDGVRFSVFEKSYLRSSSLELIFQPYFGLQCSLPIELIHETAETSIQMLRNMVDEELSYSAICKHQDKTFVELYQNDENVADMLARRGLGSRLQIVPTGPAFISHVSSTIDFAVQMNSSTQLLKKIMTFNKKYTQVDVKSPKEGMLVQAFCPEYGFWYRAKITKLKGSGEFEVYYIDHGNSGIVKKIGEICDPVISSISPLAIRCKFLMFPTSPDAELKFLEVAAKGLRMVDVKMVNAGKNHAVINMFIQGRSVLEMLVDPQNKIPDLSSKDEDW